MNITWYKIISEFNPLSNYNKLDFQWLKRNDLWECNFQTPFQTPKLNYLSANHISLHNNAYKHVISSYNLITVFVRSMLITWKFFTWVCVGACYLKRATIVFLNSTEVISGGCQILKTTEWFDQIFIDSKLLIFNIELEVFFTSSEEQWSSTGHRSDTVKFYRVKKRTLIWSSHIILICFEASVVVSVVNGVVTIKVERCLV